MNTKPIFPEFSDIHITSQATLHSSTHRYLPYSDFNFISLWSYNTENDARFSFLHDNLVICFRDYVSNQPFYTFLGDNRVTGTIRTLLKKSQEEGMEPVLKLIPESNLVKTATEHNDFTIQEDRDSFDYILSVEEVLQLEGKKYETKRHHLKNFSKSHPGCHVSQLNMNDPATQKEMLEIFAEWVSGKGKKEGDAKHELSALTRFLTVQSAFNTICVGVFAQTRLIGFAVSELLSHGYSIGHFKKARLGYRGINDLLVVETAKIVHERGQKYMNIEQDLGIEGLRNFKTSWRPITMLKKYTISGR